MKLLQTLACCACVGLSGCSWLPNAGFERDAVLEPKEAAPPYTVLEVNQATVDAIRAMRPPTLHTAFAKAGQPPEERVSVGDTVDVSIWEVGGGLLSPDEMTPEVTPGNSREDAAPRPLSLPQQTVMRDGTIAVPFAGRVKVMGLTISEVERDIVQHLGTKLRDPQVIVTVPKSVASSVAVSGDVVSGARVLLSPKGDRLLDLVAESGGSKAPAYETTVRLTRAGTTASVSLAHIIEDPYENIYAWPGDVLTLERQPRSFVALGATGRNAEINFETEHPTLIQAVARANGLLDDRADATAVFLFRNETALLVSQLNGNGTAGATDGTVPVVYHLDLSRPQTYLLAQDFPMKNGDVIFVANSGSQRVYKFFQLLGTLTSPVVTGAVIKNEAN